MTQTRRLHTDSYSISLGMLVNNGNKQVWQKRARQRQGKHKAETRKKQARESNWGSGKNNDWEKRSNPWRSETGFFSSDMARRIAGSLEKQETTARYCKLLAEELNSTLFSTWYMIKVPLHKSSHQQNQDNLYNANPTSAVVLVWESALQVKSMFYRKCFRKDFQEQKTFVTFVATGRN